LLNLTASVSVLHPAIVFRPSDA